MNTSLTPLPLVSRPIRTVLLQVMLVAIWLSKYRRAQALFMLFVLVCGYSGVQQVVALCIWLKWRVSDKYPSRAPGFTSGFCWVRVAQLCCILCFWFLFFVLCLVWQYLWIFHYWLPLLYRLLKVIIKIYFIVQIILIERKQTQICCNIWY